MRFENPSRHKHGSLCASPLKKMSYRREILSNPTKWWDSLTSDERISLVKNLKIDRQLRQKRKMRLNYSLGLDEIFETYWPDYNISEKLTDNEIIDILELKHLTFSKTTLTNIDFIDPIIKAQHLYINDTRIDSIDVLTSINKLKTLDCSTTAIKDFNPLRYLVKLTELDLSLTDFQNGLVLENCVYLKKLHLYKTSLEYTYGFEKLVSLEELFLNCSPVKNLWGLQDLKKLKRIFCEHTDIEDLYPISTLTNLRAIYCSYTKIKSLESAYGHPKLEFIQCDNTFITDKDLDNSRYHIKSVYIVEPDLSRFDNQEAKDYVEKINREEIEKIRKDIKERDGD